MEQPQERNIDSELEAKLKRFEERVAIEEEHQNKGRPKRSAQETVAAAIVAIKKQRDSENERLMRGGFRMAAQEQAQRETVRELDWLLEDLVGLHDVS